MNDHVNLLPRTDPTGNWPNGDVILANNVFLRGRAHIFGQNLAHEIYVAQINALYQQIPMVLSVDLISSLLSVIVLSSHRLQSRWFVFLSAILMLSAIRACGWYAYRIKKHFNFDTTNWALYATMGSGLSGLLWGVGGAWLLPNDLVKETFFAFVIGGMCAAPLVSFSYYFPAFLAYVIPATLPLAGRFLMNNWAVNGMVGDMILVFATAITLAAYNSNQAFTNLLGLNFDLTKKTNELRRANILLKTEIAQRKGAEAQLHQSQKMEAIGQLTGGIAHDFNNLLTGVIGHLDLARRRAIDDPRMCALLRAARHPAERGATLTRQLLAFARRQHLDPRSVDVFAVVKTVEEMLQRTIGPDIRLGTKADGDVAPAWVDPNQLELAILNLALNARDAMPKGGVLIIGAQNRRACTGDCPRDLAPGDYVVVSVMDTGAGMSHETLTRAIEPFFTTKDKGYGSGLGLSMVDGFAAQSGGSVQISSILGEGTKVDLWLPGAKDRAVEGGDNVELYAAVTYSNQARILVCDDDDDVRTFVVDALREMGFKVWGANGASEGLAILQREAPMDLLVVDYAMPEMNGLAVIARSRACQPGLKVLVMTGYAEILRADGIGGLPLLKKPFDACDLEKRIAELLDEPLATNEQLLP